MKKMRILSAVCAAAILTTMVASCGAKDGGSDAKKEKSPELVYWTIGGATGKNEDGLKATSDYVKDKLGFTVKVNIADWGDWDTRINTMLNSGEYFDLMFMNNTKYANAVDIGAFADITDLVDKEAPKLKEVIPEEVWEGVEIKDKIYGVPTYKDSSLTQYWYIDRQYVDKYNIDMSKVTTFEALDKVLYEMKKGEGKNFYPIKTGQGSRFNGLFNGYDGLSVGLPPLGVDINDKECKVVNILEQPEILKRLDYLHKWFKDGIINPDAATSTETYKQLPFGTAQGFPGAEATWEINNGVKEYVPVEVFGPLYTRETIQGSLNSVGNRSKYKAEALKFLELANTDSKLRDMMAYGAPDKDFKYVEDGVVERMNDNYSWPSYTQATYFNLSTVKGNPKDQWDKVKEMNETATKSPLLAFNFDIQPVASEVTACKTVYENYKYELETGARDPKELLPELQEKLKQSGFDKVMKEAQKQIDEFLASQSK